MSDQPETAPRRRLPPLVRGVLTGLALALGFEVVRVYLGGNLHEVVPRAVYRCAQPDRGQLAALVKNYHIRTVVNLRGVCATADWYQDECRALADLGVSQEDLGFSAGRLPSASTLRRLVDVIDHSDYPILFHCHKGIDRTGLAVALTLLLRTDLPLAEARRQLGPRYGHLPVGRTAYLDQFFRLYDEWLAGEGVEHSRATFRRWVVAEYCPGECRARIERLGPREGPTALPAGRPAGLRVRCTNTSVRPWRMRPVTTAGVHAHWKLWDDRGHEVSQGRSGLFDTVVAAGEHIDLTLSLPPLSAGRYLMRVDLMDMEHATFVQGGSEPLDWELEVP